MLVVHYGGGLLNFTIPSIMENKLCLNVSQITGVTFLC